MIEFKNVSKFYDKQKIVKDISFKITNGDIVVLIGSSGCGKTTLLKMINRLIKPSSGEIIINGENIETKNDIELRRNIGYVIQQTGLFPHMTIRQNIEIIPKLQKLDKQKIMKKTAELMDMVGLEPNDYLDRYPFQLSGGQQQRIGVARAFACDPEIILMDEPFSALDPITRNQLQDELISIQASYKKTIVFVTHDMDEAIKIADKICVINNGMIEQYDSVEEIMKRPANEFVSEFVGKNRIWSSPELIKVEDIMITDPVCAAPELSVLRCIEKMRKNKVDHVFINDKKKLLQGILSVKTAQSCEDKSIMASQVMKKDFLSLSKEMSMSEVLEINAKENKSVLPVVEDDKLIGIITKSSLLTALSQQYIAEDTEKEWNELF